LNIVFEIQPYRPPPPISEGGCNGFTHFLNWKICSYVEYSICGL
jgi:hypothetical protein